MISPLFATSCIISRLFIFFLNFLLFTTVNPHISFHEYPIDDCLTAIQWLWIWRESKHPNPNPNLTLTPKPNPKLVDKKGSKQIFVKSLKYRGPLYQP